MTERAPTRPQAETDDHATASPTSGGERRRNPRLRELVDEMLASVRVAARRDLWSDAERKQYEAELAEIMRRVRFEAVNGGPTSGPTA